MRPGSAPVRFWTDQRMNRMVAVVLRGGVLLAAGITLIGGLGVLVLHGREVPDYRTFQGGPAGLRSLPGILQGALHLDLPAVVQLGVVLLIATPITRVLVTLVGFLVQRDRIYGGITCLVLLALLYGLLLGGPL